MARRPQKKRAWFIKVRGSYLPNSWQGWLTYIPYVYFLVITFMAVNRHSHSVSDVAIGIVPYWVSAVVVMQWLASRKS